MHFAAPTVGDRVLAAGPVLAHITRAPGTESCTIDDEDWGGDPDEPAPEADTWYLRSLEIATADPCNVQITLPLANGGEGLTGVIDW